MQLAQGPTYDAASWPFTRNEQPPRLGRVAQAFEEADNKALPHLPEAPSQNARPSCPWTHHTKGQKPTFDGAMLEFVL